MENGKMYVNVITVTFTVVHVANELVTVVHVANELVTKGQSR